MLDHLLIHTPAESTAQTVSFYIAALAPLGVTKKVEYLDGNVVGLGAGTGHASFWVTSNAIRSDKSTKSCAHFAFSASDRQLVEECYQKGLEAGGKDNGPPGLRSHYHESYYAAFLIDPAGNNMEIVHRTD